jgi:hypothetical protein
VVVGLSGPDSGIDEALVAVSSGKVPTVALQDFWGDLNRGFGAVADVFVVLDQMARRLTLARGVDGVEPCGSVKYTRYTALDIPALRRQGRQALLAGDATRLVGLYGQPLWHWPGYTDMLLRFVDSLSRHWPGAVLAYRPHPAERDSRWPEIETRAVGSGLVVKSATSLSIEASLAAADLVVSSFSSVGQDALMLSRASPEPLGAVLYLLHDKAVWQAYRDYTALDGLPPAEAGLARQALENEQLDSILLELTPKEARQALWRQIRRSLPDLGGAGSCILNLFARL